MVSNETFSYFVGAAIINKRNWIVWIIWSTVVDDKMLFQSLRTVLGTLVRPLAVAPSPQLNQLVSRPFHLLSSLKPVTPVSPMSGTPNVKLLASPGGPQLVQTCGFKVKGILRRRCRDCYFVMRQGRLYNLCSTHPRHKQMQKVKKPKNTWIVTHAFQSKVRPWWAMRRKSSRFSIVINLIKIIHCFDKQSSYLYCTTTLVCKSLPGTD